MVLPLQHLASLRQLLQRRHRLPRLPRCAGAAGVSRLHPSLGAGGAFLYAFATIGTPVTVY